MVLVILHLAVVSLALVLGIVLFRRDDWRSSARREEVFLGTRAAGPWRLFLGALALVLSAVCLVIVLFFPETLTRLTFLDEVCAALLLLTALFETGPFTKLPSGYSMFHNFTPGMQLAWDFFESSCGLCHSMEEVRYVWFRILTMTSLVLALVNLPD